MIRSCRVQQRPVCLAITYTKGADSTAAVVKDIEKAGGKAIAIQADAAVQNMPDATLILYPDANHGSWYQYHEDFVFEVNRVLDKD